MNSSNCIIRCYGITQNPETNDLVMVMDYAEKGNLRQHLNENFITMDWKDKLFILIDMAKGLDIIHKNGLIHHDFHCGNILMSNVILITDLGLCQPVNQKPAQNDQRSYSI